MIHPESLAASITAAAVSISQGRSAEDLDLLSAVFTQLADTIATIAAARSSNADNAS